MFLNFKNFFLLIFVCSLFVSSAQMSYHKEFIDRQNTSVLSDIAYKLPYRGENYKFYGTINFHIYGKAFVNNKLYNAFIEAQQLSKKNIESVQIRVYKSSGKHFGHLDPRNTKRCGNRIVFMTPMLKKGIPVRYYYRTGLFRQFYKFNSAGASSGKSKICIDFETLAQYLINLDDAAHFFGIRVKSVTLKKDFIKHLYKTSKGKELKERDIRFIKYLSPKINRKYEELFLVVFE
jgi:penicillin-insensitive murein DD-endopeptidase